MVSGSEADQPAEAQLRAGCLALRRERRLLCLIALLAAARVLLFSSVFPLFNNVDEYSHFDAVYKYAHGELPHPDRLRHDTRASALIIWLQSPEYFAWPSSLPGTAHPGPLWSVSPEVARMTLRKGVQLFTGKLNHELAQPPVYYMVASWVVSWQLWRGRRHRPAGPSGVPRR